MYRRLFAGLDIEEKYAEAIVDSVLRLHANPINGHTPSRTPSKRQLRTLVHLCPGPAVTAGARKSIAIGSVGRLEWVENCLLVEPAQQAHSLHNAAEFICVDHETAVRASAHLMDCLAWR
jgi:hypothetical protein